MKLTCPYCNQEVFCKDRLLKQYAECNLDFPCPVCGSDCEVFTSIGGTISLQRGMTVSPDAQDFIDRMLKEFSKPLCCCDTPILGPDAKEGYVCENCFGMITKDHELYAKYKEYEV